MKKVLTIILAFLLVFCFCKKKSTDSEVEEDKIVVEVLVKENGSPVQNMFVEISAKVQEAVKNFGAQPDDEVISYEVTETNSIATNQYGKATFSYNNKSLPDRGGIVIDKVVIKQMSTEVHQDDIDKFVKKGATLNLEYEL